MIRAAQAAAVLRAQQEKERRLGADSSQLAEEKVSKSARGKAKSSKHDTIAHRIGRMSHQSAPKPTNFAKAADHESEAVTTLMIRNIPNTYTRKLLSEELDEI